MHNFVAHCWGTEKISTNFFYYCCCVGQTRTILPSAKHVRQHNDLAPFPTLPFSCPRGRDAGTKAKDLVWVKFITLFFSVKGTTNAHISLRLRDLFEDGDRAMLMLAFLICQQSSLYVSFSMQHSLCLRTATDNAMLGTCKTTHNYSR